MYVDSYFTQAIGNLFIGALVITLICYLINALIYSSLFKKAGRPGWAAFIPVYNTWVLFEICYLPGWLALFAFVPFLNFVCVIVSIIALYRLPQCYEKAWWWGILNIFFSLIIMIICAFDRSEYCGYEK